MRCLQCKIQIYDFDNLTEQELKLYSVGTDPYSFRLRYLSKRDANKPLKIQSQLENSQAHRKSNKGICGLFGKFNSLPINTVAQYFSHIPLYKGIFKNLLETESKADTEKLINSLAGLIKNLWDGSLKAMPAKQFHSIIWTLLPGWKSYKRKDPFQLFSLILNTLHDKLKFVDYTDLAENVPDDEWQISKKQNQNSSKYKEYSPVTHPLKTRLSYLMRCQKCKKENTLESEVLGIRLALPKLKRSAKQLDIEYKRYRYESPLKQRRRSLIQRFLGAEEQIPLTLLQLFFNYLRDTEAPLKNCGRCTCGENLTKQTVRISKLPQMLLIQIPRLNRDGYTIDKKVLEVPQTLDLKGLCVQGINNSNSIFEFRTAICVQPESGQFLTVARHHGNRKLYEYRNEQVTLLSNQNYSKLAPYLMCYSVKIPDGGLLYKNIKSNIQANIEPEYPLPDFWMQGLKYVGGWPLADMRVCRHGKLKARFSSKQMNAYQQRIPRQIYEALLERFGGRTYEHSSCESCWKELMSLAQRRKLERTLISKYDSMHSSVHCMLSSKWLQRWTDFVYAKRGTGTNSNYSSKKSEPPGPITNSVLLQNYTKCKENIKKGDDYKIVNYYVWSFLKQLYGGGPQIQYRSESPGRKKESGLYVLGNEYETEGNDEEVIIQAIRDGQRLRGYLEESFYMSREWEEASPTTSRKRRSSLSGSTDAFVPPPDMRKQMFLQPKEVTSSTLF